MSAKGGGGVPISEWCFYSLGHTLSEECLKCCRSADHSPNKIILTEQKLEERKRWVNFDLHLISPALRSPDVGLVLPDMSLFREMELKRRKKKEETTSTENKIAQMKVLVKKFSRLLTLCFSEGNSQSRGVESAQGVLAAKCSSLLRRPLHLRHRLPPVAHQLNSTKLAAALLPPSPPLRWTLKNPEIYLS